MHTHYITTFCIRSTQHIIHLVLLHEFVLPFRLISFVFTLLHFFYSQHGNSKKSAKKHGQKAAFFIDNLILFYRISKLFCISAHFIHLIFTRNKDSSTSISYNVHFKIGQAIFNHSYCFTAPTI